MLLSVTSCGLSSSLQSRAPPMSGACACLIWNGSSFKARDWTSDCLACRLFFLSIRGFLFRPPSHPSYSVLRCCSRARGHTVKMWAHTSPYARPVAFFGHIVVSSYIRTPAYSVHKGRLLFPPPPHPTPFGRTVSRLPESLFLFGDSATVYITFVWPRQRRPVCFLLGQTRLDTYVITDPRYTSRSSLS